MKAPNKSEFKKLERMARARQDKIAALRKLGDSEAMKVYKAMGVHSYGKPRINLIGFFHPNGKQPLRCK